MTNWSGTRTIVRLVLAAFCWLTALYAFVVSSAFAYLQFVRPRVFPWVGHFSDWHAVLLAVWTVLAGAVLWPEITSRTRARPVAIGFFALCVMGAVWNLFNPVLPRLTDGDGSIAIGILALLPIVAFAVIDYINATAYLREQRPDWSDAALAAIESRLLTASIATSVFLTVVYAVIAASGLTRAFEPELSLVDPTRVGILLIEHLVVFNGVFLTLALAVRLAGGSVLRQLLAIGVVLVVAFAVVFERIVGGALSLHGPYALAAAGATAFSIVAAWSGLSLRVLQRRKPALQSALDVFFGRGEATRAGSLLRLTAICALAAGFIWLSSLADWDFALLRAGVIVVWASAFGAIYRWQRWTRSWRGGAMAAICVVPLAGAWVIELGAAPETAYVNGRLLDRYAVYNPSFRVADGMLRRTRASSTSFDNYLRLNTGLTAVQVDPIDIDFVPHLEATTAPKPLIFLFVIDSLRPDYLAAYNPQVKFTPRIAEFAKESVVFTNAFTRFGGTGLSVPAMWAGSSIVHKQYVLPFHRMNALEKLLDVNHYRKVLGLDSIMSQLLVRSDSIDELDRGRINMDFEICRTLDELDGRLQTIDPATPVFAYSLPQDIHMSRLPRTVEAGEEYQSFHAPYATKVHAFDTCFGRFVDRLKAHSLYDRSLIVVTSDHGEMLGEDGQFGHSYHLFPQVVQIPLIIHFPKGLAGVESVDPDAVSLSTDITPTIYAALGYRPERSNDLMGRPLIGADDDMSTARRRDTYVIAASYGAVYAVLRHNGRRLYIADAVKGGDRAYERVAGGRWNEVPVSEGLRVVNQFAIRQYIDELARIYRVPNQ